MSDAPQQPDAGLAREAGTGRYVQRHAASEDAPADASAPAETPAAAPAAAASADAPTTEPVAASDKADTPPATQSGGDATPPAAPPPAGPGEEKDGRKRWMLLLLLLLILLALLCAGFSYMTWWRKDKPSAEPTQTPTVSVTSTGTGNPRPSPSLTSTPNTSPSPSPSPTSAVKMVNVPNVVGMPATDAKAILEGAGLTNIKFVPEDNPNTELSVIVSYTVTRQSVAGGTQVPADTAIVITSRTTSNGKG
jgi:hypothetical protein